jgi:benzoate membrane transport protein
MVADIMMTAFKRDWSQQAMMQGLVVAIVGYASSVALVIQGLKAVGASSAQISSALVMLGLGKGVVAIALSVWTRMPISVAWTTPGVALLAVTPVVAGGFPAVVGAFVACAVLIMIAALWQPLAQLIRAIPKSIANAMLAGILFKLCLAPFIAFREKPLVAGAILLTWVVMSKVNRLYAVPAAVAVAIGAILHSGETGITGSLVPSIVWTTPVFTAEALISLAIPLFIVTMASQNITGLAVLSTFDYRPNPKVGLLATGGVSALTAPLGAPAINFAAITAALCAGSDAHPDRDRRYVAAVVAGLGYIACIPLAAIATQLVVSASPILIEAAAGLALIGAFAGAAHGAVQVEEERIPAMATLLVTASGLSFFNIGAAFWGLLIGCGMLLFFRWKPGKVQM